MILDIIICGDHLITKKNLCDGILDCSDKRDEDKCGKLVMTEHNHIDYQKSLVTIGIRKRIHVVLL